MFGTDHRDHKFDHLGKVYERHLKDIRTEEEFIKKRLREYSKEMEDLEHTIKKIQKEKDEKANEVKIVVNQIYARLESQLKDKLMALLAQKGVMADEIDYLESLENDINKEITEATKSSLVSRSKDLVKILAEIKDRPATKFSKSDISIDFP